MADEKGKLDITDEELIHQASQVDETSLEDLDTEVIGPNYDAGRRTWIDLRL